MRAVIVNGRNTRLAGSAQKFGASKFSSGATIFLYGATNFFYGASKFFYGASGRMNSLENSVTRRLAAHQASFAEINS